MVKLGEDPRLIFMDGAGNFLIALYYLGPEGFYQLFIGTVCGVNRLFFRYDESGTSPGPCCEIVNVLFRGKAILGEIREVRGKGYAVRHYDFADAQRREEVFKLSWHVSVPHSWILALKTAVAATPCTPGQVDSANS